MLQSIIFQSKQGDIDLMQDPTIKVIDIQGVSAISNINTSSISGYDGAVLVSSEVPMRNITLMLQFEVGDAEYDMRRLYTLFPVKSFGVLYFLSSLNQLKIECIIEKVEIPPNAHPLKAQISLLCPQPYWESLTEIQSYIAQIVPLWEFPFEIDDDVGFEISEISQSLITNVPNSGEVDTGCVFVFYATGNCKNPKIENINTHEWIQVGLSGGNLELNMVAGDVLKIDTRLGQKAITYIHNDVEQNYINYKVYGSKFLQLAVGDNEFRYSAEENERNLEITVYYTEKFGGV